MKIRITWSDGTQSIETGHNPCINQPEFTAESLYQLFVNMASMSDIKPVSYEEVE